MDEDLKLSMHHHVKSSALTNYPSDNKENEIYEKYIIYKFNDEGFRCDYDIKDLEFYDVNMFLGCSNTLGVGVNNEETWCHHVNDHYQGRRTMFNMGQGGGSSETCYRLAQYWIPKIKPKAVFMLTPPSTRREFWTEDEGPQIMGLRRFGSVPTILPKHMIGETEIQLNRVRVRDAIEMLCVRQKIPFYYIYFHGQLLKWGGSFDDFGRDGVHPGPDTHKKIAKLFTDQNPV